MSAWLYAPGIPAGDPRRYVVSFSDAAGAANRFGFGLNNFWAAPNETLIYPMFTRPDGGPSENYGPTGWEYQRCDSRWGWTFVMAVIGSGGAPSSPHWLWFSHYQNDGRGVGGSGGPLDPFPGTPSAKAAIGALADGSANFLQGEIEDLRFYDINVVWPAFIEWPSVDRVGLNTLHSRGRDARLRLMHPNLVYHWPLRGVGPVTTEVDKKAGISATGMNGVAYSRSHLPYRRRNRGG